MENKTVNVQGWSRIHSDHKHPMWWGIVGLIVIELTVVSIFLASYFYLWIVNASKGISWPPNAQMLPSPALEGINLILLGICGWSMWYGGIVSRKGRLETFVWLVVLCCLSALAALVLRWIELSNYSYALGEHAYATFIWTLSGFHFMHVLSAVLGTVVIGWFAWKGYYSSERMLGINVDTLYWYFVCGIWVPIYFSLYIAPRFL